MTPIELREHKRHCKKISALPTFTPLNKKNNRLPRPLDQLGRRKDAHSSGMIRVSDSHVAFFLYRDGEILTDRSFYGYLFCELQNSTLSTLYEFHWHPSHKGIHCKLPCNTANNYAGRLLVQAPELQIASASTLDPAKESDRKLLVEMFCKKCGIELSLPKAMPEARSNQADLFDDHNDG